MLFKVRRSINRWGCVYLRHSLFSFVITNTLLKNPYLKAITCERFEIIVWISNSYDSIFEWQNRYVRPKCLGYWNKSTKKWKPSDVTRSLCRKQSFSEFEKIYFVSVRLSVFRQLTLKEIFLLTIVYRFNTTDYEWIIIVIYTMVLQNDFCKYWKKNELIFSW